MPPWETFVRRSAWTNISQMRVSTSGAMPMPVSRTRTTAWSSARFTSTWILPPRSVHFALSLLALEWMDQVPAEPVPEFISYVRGSPAAREAYARQARAASMQRGATLNPVISDVNQAAVEALMRGHRATLLLHGHTHRPAVHEFTLDGQPAKGIVLGDWYEQGSVVRWDSRGPRLEFLPRQ